MESLIVNGVLDFCGCRRALIDQQPGLSLNESVTGLLGDFASVFC
jgi:hypothetical protein